MATILYQIEVAANAAKAREALEQTATVVVTTAARLEKLTASFSGSGLFRSAHDYAAAIQNVGGASKLTSAEQERMHALFGKVLDKAKALGKEVPPAFQQIYDATKKVPDPGVESGLGRIVKSLGPIGPMIAGAFSVRAIVGFVSSLVGAADGIQKTADKLQGTAEEAQRLQYVGGQTSVSIESLTSASQELQRRLGDGDAGTVGALKRLGLHAKVIHEMPVDERLFAIGEALQSVHDETQRAALAEDVFGKNWKELMPALLSDMRTLAGEAPTIKNATVAALDAAGDRWDWLKGKVKVAGAEVLNFVFNTARLATAADFWEDLERPVVKNHDAIMRTVHAMLDASDRTFDLGVSMEEADRIGRALTDTVTAQAKAHEDNTRKVQAFQQVVDDATGKASYHKAVEALRVLAAAGDHVDPTKLAELVKTIDAGVTAGMRLGVAVPLAMQQVAGSALEATGPLQRQHGALDEILASVLALNQQMAVPVPPIQIRATLDEPLLRETIRAGYGVVDRELSTGLGQSLMGLITDFPQALMAAFQGGGGVGGAFNSLFSGVGGAMGTSVFGDLAAKGSQFFASTFGTKVTQALGTIIPGLGGVIGSLAGPLISKIGSWFGGNSEGRKLDQDATSQIQALQAELLKTHGSLQQIDAIGRSIGVDLAGAWGDRSRAGLVHFSGLVDQFNAKLQDQKALQEQIAAVEGQIGQLRAGQIPTWQQMASLIDQYGIDVAGLGDQVQQLKIADMATALLNAFETLTAGGADANGVLAGMSDEISDLVQQSMTYGVAIPENMRPIIESLAAQGLLFGANKLAITDLSGLKWGAPVESEADKINATLTTLNETLQTLTERLAGLAGVSATSAAQVQAQWEKAPWEGWTSPEFPSRDGLQGWDPSWPGHAAGGVFQTPHAAWIAEGGQPEIVGSVGFMRAALRGALADTVLPRPGGTPDGRDDAGLREEMGAIRRLLRDFPRAVGIAVKDAQVLARRPA